MSMQGTTDQECCLRKMLKKFLPFMKRERGHHLPPKEDEAKTQ